VVVAVVPLKNLTAAKSRLTPLLDGAERCRLVEAMLADVLGALSAARGLTEVFVVSDGEGLSSHGFSLILEAENRGYDEAVATALSDPRVAGADAVLVLPGDLPLITAEDVDSFIGTDFARLSAPAVRIAPARDGDGTNALLIAPPGLMVSQFGPGSFQRHKHAAERVASTVEIVAPPGLAFDIDTPQDLLEFRARDSDTATHAFLRESGVAERLRRADLC
jgi:2-phospho-L-lactate/phosphoenolpyruvate guanylyltransferase